ncbi:anti-repressor SinI family protein [Salibacterium qingdaonense]|uniref:Anti-repressor SinI n=1 Tax=Salibacterium qingdaonense TaxID=266892 RepID=A0A1I4MNB0_9BACI|nr:anti-repressor SinI family protein [Salibacterium qingdaonense]SFM04517.1 Anti-repressor SinI [Salibacterium qingdaonense]
MQNPEKFDQEWVILIMEAKRAGLTAEEVKAFLNKESVRS